MRKRSLFFLGVALVLPLELLARTSLVVLPNLGESSLNLPDGERSLQTETREMILTSGEQTLEFYWEGVFLDRESLRLELAGPVSGVVVLDAVFPPEESAVIWRVYSERDLKVVWKISYHLRQLDRLNEYRMELAPGEEVAEALQLRSVVRNFSGITLGESQLVMDRQERSLEGMEHQETLRLPTRVWENLLLSTVIVWDSRRDPWDPEGLAATPGFPFFKEFLWEGDRPLGEGNVRVWQKQENGKTTFLGESNMGFVPTGDVARIRLGETRDLRVTQRRLSSEVINARTNRWGQRVLYDLRETFEVKLENFRDHPARLEMLQEMQGEWEMVSCPVEYQSIGPSHLRMTVPLEPGEEQSFRWIRLERNLRK